MRFLMELGAPDIVINIGIFIIIILLGLHFFIKFKRLNKEKKRENSFKSSKIAITIIGILAVGLFIFTWIDYSAPYIQFDNEVFTSKETANYRNVEITIKDIYYANEYTYQGDILKYDEYGNETHLTEETLYPEKGYEYMFVDIEVNNNSEKNFNISGICWMARTNKKAYGEKSKDDKNRFSYVVKPNAKDVNTLLFEIPKDQKEVELIYYDNINKKPTNRKPISKAPNFVIKLEKENND